MKLFSKYFNQCDQCISCQNVIDTDGQSDGRTTRRGGITALCIASRGKNCFRVDQSRPYFSEPRRTFVAIFALVN